MGTQIEKSENQHFSICLSHLRLNLAMESKLNTTPVRSHTWHATPTEKVVIPATKRPATTLGIAHSPATTSTAVLRRPKTISGINLLDPGRLCTIRI